MPIPSMGTTLNAKEQHFAHLIALGYEQTLAYRKAFKAKGINLHTMSSRATKLAHNDLVKEAAKAFLSQLKIADLDSAGQYLVDLLQDIQTVRAKGNWGALASLMRLRGQVLGILQENVNMRQEDRLTDAQLIAQLAGKDEHKQAMLKAILGEGTAYRT